MAYLLLLLFILLENYTAKGYLKSFCLLKIK